jgi:H+/Cl- antiporter ClcA
VLDLLLAIVVGVLAALIVAGVRRFGTRIDTVATPRLGLPVVLLGGGAMVGVLAQLADVLGADAQDVLFSGQASIPSLLGQDSTRIVLILLVAKAVAYGLCLGCGFRGGPVFPAMFIGVALATFGSIWFDVSPTAALAMGAAAGMAAMTRLVLTPILFGALLAGTAGLDAVPAAVLAAVAAWITIQALEQGAEAPHAGVEAVPGQAVR